MFRYLIFLLNFTTIQDKNIHPSSSFFSFFHSPTPPPPPENYHVFLLYHHHLHLVVRSTTTASLRPHPPHHIQIHLRLHHHHLLSLPLLEKIPPNPHPIPPLLSANPLSLPPLALLSFFQWFSSTSHFRSTLHSYLSMAHFLCRHRLPSHTLPLLRLLISRKGKDPSPSLFSVAVEAVGPECPMLLCSTSRSTPTWT